MIDVGAGTSYNSLDFFMYSDIQICVTLPDPTSILDFYTFLQLATIRKVLDSFLSQSDVSNILKSQTFTNLSEVFELAEQTQEGARKKAQEALKYFHPLLIVNRDAANGTVNKTKLNEMITKYLGIEIPTLGKIPDDPNVTKALKAFMPVSALYPTTPASISLQTIAGKMEKLVDLFSHQKNKTTT